MSAFGHKRTFAVQTAMSALPDSDLCRANRHVRFTPNSNADSRKRSSRFTPESKHVQRTGECRLLGQKRTYREN